MSLLQDLSALYASVPFQWKLIGHCLIVSSWFTTHKDKFLLNYWTGFLGAFGGGCLSALILQQSSDVAVALFEANMIGITWTLCWWLINYSPYNLVAQMHNLLPVRMVSKTEISIAPAQICMNMLRAGIIAQRVNVSEGLYPGVAGAALFIGTIAASGGKLLVDLIQQLTGDLKTRAEIVEPGFPLRTGFFGTLLYWVTVYWLGVLKPAEGGALVTTIFVAHGIAADLTGRPLDFTEPLARALHAITNVPMPGLQAPQKTAKAPAPTTNGKALETKKGK